MLRKQWNSYVIARQRAIARPLMITSYNSVRSRDRLFILASGRKSAAAAAAGTAATSLSAANAQSARYFRARSRELFRRSIVFKNSLPINWIGRVENITLVVRRITLFIHANRAIYRQAARRINEFARARLYRAQTETCRVLNTRVWKGRHATLNLTDGSVAATIDENFSLETSVRPFVRR